MEKNIIKRFISSLIDKIIILLLFITIEMCISPYSFAGTLGTYSALIEMSPSHYYSQSLYTTDSQITTLFIITNFIYYLICECTLKAALGKRLCKLTIISNYSQNQITIMKAIKRNILLSLLMALAVFIRFTLDINYIIVIVAFFFILDVSVLFKGQSLIDLLTNTCVIKQK